MIKKLNKLPLELLFFVAALTLLFFLNTTNSPHTLCPLALMGFDFCPGCGLGRSLHYLMHLDFKKSFEMHPLGFFAFFVIIYRIITLSKITFHLNTKKRSL